MEKNNIEDKRQNDQNGYNDNYKKNHYNTHSGDAVVVKSLKVQFDSFYAVNDISFQVKKGEIFGFLGANGAGKTTTIRVLCGLLHPTEGSVEVAGIPFKSDADEKKIKSKVGYMSQKLTLYDDLTVNENLSFLASLRNMPIKKFKKRRDEILDFISFKKSLDSYVRDLSGGIKQQVALAGSILHDPEVVFLDEPTAGVSPGMRARFWELIQDLAKNGKTLFVTTHYMDEAEQCERIALMREGKIVDLDSPDNLKSNLFKEDMYECIPAEKITYEELQKISKNEGFQYFEPYGFRFHAVFKDNEKGEALKSSLSKNFEINKIMPTLEDVFIKKTEHKKFKKEGNGKGEEDKEK